MVSNRWINKTVGELIKFEGGSQPPRDTFNFEPKEGYVRLLQIRDYKTDKFKTYIPIHLARKFCDETDIMIGRYGPPIFQILRGLRGAYNVALIKAIPNEENVSKDYVYYYLKQDALFELIDSLSQRTSGQTGIDMEALKSYPFPLPPKDEQRKIVSILSSVDKTIEKTKAIIEQTEKMKKGLMQQLFTKGIGHTIFKKTEFGEIPEEWEVVGIIDIAENEKNAVKPGPFGSSLKKEFYVKSGFKVYGQEQVIANDFTIGDYYIDDKKYEELNGFKVKPLDLLISLVGTFGKIAVIPKLQFKPGIINPRLLKVTFDKSKANVHFYKYYMSSSSFYQQLEGMSQGGTMGVINSKILKSIHFPLPPLDEQLRIIDILTNIDHKLNIETSKYRRLQVLKKGLMQSLLTGKVRVKVDETEVTQV
ncbi:restriction endonuclease subunit S [Gottfriedia acidiceleris]|uniref:restriction endonuclease subunit S n=1 Tax=Gottfriedia acidiceleris TaxID=371036 RepID=UPI002F2621ED